MQLNIIALICFLIFTKSSSAVYMPLCSPAYCQLCLFDVWCSKEVLSRVISATRKVLICMFRLNQNIQISFSVHTQLICQYMKCIIVCDLISFLGKHVLNMKHKLHGNSYSLLVLALNIMVLMVTRHINIGLSSVSIF